MMSPEQDTSDVDSEMEYGTPDEEDQPQAHLATHSYQDSSENIQHSMPQHSYTLWQDSPQTPPPRDDHHMDDLNDTPRAPNPNNTPRVSSSLRDQQSMQVCHEESIWEGVLNYTW